MKTIKIYTDGSCSKNPGRGSYAAIILLKENKIELSDAYEFTTNNRMELMAIIKSIEHLYLLNDNDLLKKHCIKIYSDSKYITNAINLKWLEKWKVNCWLKSDQKYILNKDLWMKLDILISDLNINFNWIKGHNDDKYNEICDSLARKALKNEKILCDVGYNTK
ncbi:MAG: ribonuclease HI [Clostridiales bacterium]|jgi:ribonuclease HI|nr:ribonuclease HI [Clostridiales bacterium]